MNSPPFVRQYGILKNKWGVFMPKGIPNQRYTGEFKQHVVETMRQERLSCRETAQRFGMGNKSHVSRWERIYLEEGPEELYIERRGRANAVSGTQKGRKPKLDKKVEEDLVAENQRLRAELDYIKNLNALVLKREQQEKKHR